jgi:hypothetical protein
MKSFLSQKDWEEILGKVYKRAALDHDFHQTCLTDAHFAIHEATGIKLSNELKIRFVEENDQFVLSLPPFVEKGQKQETITNLNEDQLERIAEKMSRMLVVI